MPDTRKIDARRVRAAVGYSGLRERQIAEQLDPDFSIDTLRNWKQHGISLRMHANRKLAPRLAAVCELPEAFWYADFSRLPELVPAGVDGAPTTPEVDRAGVERARRALDAVRDAQPGAGQRQTRPAPGVERRRGRS